ncbi:TAXI family TRAP transporter solute-binding subunit [Variovorax sp. PCZ-1]|uniref:TAXI family TRAP transporter solute-binding subunit n=1 Tax=Variovorax sp. PCZ-1 TaxID=2835533 RepID=UPI001BCE0AB5|nr:TAXI family TRAP transporter solute-binding subunit [Variovorax sp. PCZ-1]MBS7806363.1 ABC transporter substrate-binding protein [Variovorax sp. PCZ-1]
MTKTIRYTLISIRDLFVSFGPFIVLGIVLLGMAYWWLNPNPPKTVTLATGPAQSAYDELGKKYVAYLKANGITVKTVQTEGSSANLKLLRDGLVDVGFVQGGTNELTETDQDNLETLGSLFMEPIWLFYREESAAKLLAAPVSKAKTAAPAATPTLSAITQLPGWKLNVGTEGSGVPKLMTRLLESNRVELKEIKLSTLDQTPAAMALLGGEIDALVFASAPESLMVQMLLQTPGIKLMDLQQSEAYSRRFNFLSPAVLPRGVVDLALDNPKQDVRLVGPTASLITRNTTHPALLQLFTSAAHQIHGVPGWFAKSKQYPNAQRDELPMAQEADRYLKNGPPLLQRYLPFWFANLVERMWVALSVIIVVLLPLSRILPPLYTFRVRSRIFKWYAQLRNIEDRDSPDPQVRASLIDEINALDGMVEKIKIPLSHADELYALRSNIHLVRKKLMR